MNYKQKFHLMARVVMTLLLAVLFSIGARATSTFEVKCKNNIFTITRTDDTTEETVFFRTVSLSAVAGVHFTPLYGQYTFKVGDKESNDIEVREMDPEKVPAVYRYLSGNYSRYYRFEVLDLGGFHLASADKSIIYSYKDYNVPSNAFNERSISVISSSAETKVTDEGYDQKKGGYAVSVTDYYNSAAPKDYLLTTGAELRMKVSLYAKEEIDGYQHIQVVANSSSYDKSGKDKGDPGSPSVSCYVASFSHNDAYVNKTYSYYSFPVLTAESNCGEVLKPWKNKGNSVGDLHQQRFKANCRASDGRIIIPTNLTSLTLRFDASGNNEDDWYVKTVYAEIQAVDEVHPTLEPSGIVVSPGPYCKGNDVYVSVPFSEIVKFSSGQPKLETSWGTLDYVSGNYSNTLTFKGTISKEPGTKLSVSGITGNLTDYRNNSYNGGSFLKTFNDIVIADNYNYTISYALNGGELADGYPTTYTYDAEVALPTPTRQYCAFTGWTGSNGDTPQMTVTIPSGSTGAKNYVANWNDFWGCDNEADGSKEHPYTISTLEGLNLLAEEVKGGNSFEGKYFILANDIDNFTATIGTQTNPFKGIFNGNYKKLTVNINETKTQGTAPFREISGATIKNLIVKGSVTGTTHASGLVGFARGGENLIDSCVVSTAVSNPATDGNRHIGGVVGHGTGNSTNGEGQVATTLIIKNTIFNGTLANSGDYAGGLQGWSDGNTLTIENCLVTGTYSGTGKFHPIAIQNTGSTTTATVKDTYFTESPTLTDKKYIAAAGAQVYADASNVPNNKFAQKQKLLDGNVYYVIGTAAITGLNTNYGLNDAITYKVTFKGKVLDTADYTGVITDSNGQDVTDNVTALGKYTLTVTGNNDYTGMVKASFEVVAGMTNGDGTEESPYLIGSAEDWDLFTEKINNGIGQGAYYKLTNDITLGSTENPLKTVVGIAKGDVTKRVYTPFKGHFDGGKNTITVTMSRDAELAALFGVIDGATISNLTVVGTITSTKKYLAGIAAYAYNVTGPSHFINCVSSVNLNSQVSGDGSIGGLLAQNETGNTIFEDCVFDGTITGVEGTEKCGGFINWSGNNQCKVEYTNCIMAGTINVTKNISTFHRGNAVATFTDTYYINNYGGKMDNAKQLMASAPEDEISKIINMGGKKFYKSGAVKVALQDTEYPYTTKVINVEPTVQEGDQTLTKDTDYEVGFKIKNGEDYEDVAEVKAAGEYKVIVSGKGEYAGSAATDITVEALGTTWADLQDALKNKSKVIITQDYTAGEDDAALSITKTVTLDLNGFTISRGLTEAKTDGYVILVNNGSKNNFTITDSSDSQTGTITGGWNKGNGGGIVNKGTLTLQGGTISGNKSQKSDDGKVYGTGGGIYNNGSNCSFFMTGGAVNNNSATGGGGGIHALSMKELRISGGEIKNNAGTSKGGGIRVNTNNAFISNCIFSGNTAESTDQGKGGAIYLEDKSLTVEDCVITDNQAAAEGGGFFLLKGTADFKNCTITGNTSNQGGCVSLYGGTFTMDGGNYSNNATIAKSANFYVSSKAKFNLDLDNQTANVLSDLEGSTPSSITLVGRTLYKDGDWNTICLPFDVTLVGSPLEGATAMTLDGNNSSFADDGTLTLNFVEEKETLHAGTPYIIKWEDGENLTEDNLVFTSVTINNSNHDIAFDGGKFKGTLTYKEFRDADKCIFFLGAQNTLFYPQTGATIGACRAYFDLSEMPAYTVKGFLLNFNMEASGISELQGRCKGDGREMEGTSEWYDFNGRQLGRLRKGLNISKGKIVFNK